MKRYIGWGVLALLVFWGGVKYAEHLAPERERKELADRGLVVALLENDGQFVKAILPRALIAPGFNVLLRSDLPPKRPLKRVILSVDYETLMQESRLVRASSPFALGSRLLVKVGLSQGGDVADYISGTLARGTLQDSSDNALHPYGLSEYVYQVSELTYEYYVPQKTDEVFLANCSNSVCRYHFVFNEIYEVVVEAVPIARLQEWQQFKHNLSQALLVYFDENVVEISHE